ncbi:MAG: hypothetical protein ACI4QT_07465 [Kiritimatiellia bacterium]
MADLCETNGTIGTNGKPSGAMIDVITRGGRPSCLVALPHGGMRGAGYAAQRNGMGNKLLKME